jgi:hypothetical protein
MKYLKSTILILGGVFFVAAVALFIKVYFFDLKSLWQLADANNAVAYSDPRPWFIVTSVGFLLGGLLFGVGLALTRTTFGVRDRSSEAPATDIVDTESGEQGDPGSTQPTT